MEWRVVFLILLSVKCFGQPDLLFDELMENRSYLGIPDKGDSLLMVKIILDYPESQQAKFSVAYIALRNEDAELCQQFIDSLLARPSNLTPYTYVLQGALLEAIGSSEDALKNYNLSLRSSPGFLLALAHRGMLNYHLENLSAAESDFKQILMVRSEDEDFLLNLAAVKLAQSDFEGSFEIYKQVANNAFGNASLLSEAYSGMGHAKLLAFDYNESLTLYQNAIKYNPQNAEAYYEMGLIKKYLKDVPGGCQDLLAAQKMGVKVTRKELRGCKRR
jgi:tetratricopeptide (TPR) repeat protein